MPGPLGPRLVFACENQYGWDWSVPWPLEDDARSADSTRPSSPPPTTRGPGSCRPDTSTHCGSCCVRCPWPRSCRCSPPIGSSSLRGWWRECPATRWRQGWISVCFAGRHWHPCADTTFRGGRVTPNRRACLKVGEGTTNGDAAGHRCRSRTASAVAEVRHTSYACSVHQSGFDEACSSSARRVRT